MRVAVYGLGPIGQLIAREVLKKKELNLVAAFDADQKKIGKDLAELLGLDKNTGVYVSAPSELELMLRNTGAKVVLHSTSTYLDRVYPQIVNRAGKVSNMKPGLTPVPITVTQYFFAIS
jgi:4-hydroxy-tetrahydrodipicolinate reductase